MPQRTICIQNPARLSVKDSSLSIEQGGQLVGSVPLEDIWVLIVETHQAQITTAALSRMVDEGIGVMLCGRDHMPNGLLLPIGAHSRHAEIVENQLAISKPLQKRLWQRIIQAKICNQAAALALTGKDSSKIAAISKDVFSGDTTNRESVAATAYFKEMLPSGGRREGPYSYALDYGYTVLRAGIGRTAVAGGWLVSRGLFHHNNLNAFNLVDDLIEPFRPVVDLLVVQEELYGDLTPDVRKTLASIFEYEVSFDGQTLSVQSAIEAEIDSLKHAVLESDAKLLKLPEVLPLKRIGLE